MRPRWRARATWRMRWRWCHWPPSSTSSIRAIGSVGQGNYAAANSWLDGFARAEQASGRMASSVNWGGIAEVGMFARTGAVEVSETDLRPKDVVGVLERVMTGAVAGQVVASGWPRNDAVFTHGWLSVFEAAGRRRRCRRRYKRSEGGSVSVKEGHVA